ncbi:MAG: ParA family protein [Leptospiraceae bacterium]|jgi:cellulose biosynthesis protein BcsQ|nr:ParA family protein [Leptospiraceae bacterium]
MNYLISNFKVGELSEVLGISKASVSEKLKTTSAQVIKSKADRVVSISPEAVQDYFVSRGCGAIYQRSHISIVYSCSGGSSKSTVSQGLFSSARRMKSRKQTILNGKTISAANIFCDVDSQSSSTISFIGKPQDDDKPVLKNYLNNECSLEDILIDLGDENYLIPSSLNNLYIDKILNSVQALKNAGTKFINDLDKKFGQGYNLTIDSPPAINTFLQTITIAIAQLDSSKYNAYLLSPIRALDVYGIKGAEISISETKDLVKAFNLPEPKIYSFLTMYQRNGKTSVEIMKRVLQNEVIKDTLLDDVCRYTTEYSKSNLKASSIYQGSKTTATEDITNLFLTLIGYQRPEKGNA